MQSYKRQILQAMTEIIERLNRYLQISIFLYSFSIHRITTATKIYVHI